MDKRIVLVIEMEGVLNKLEAGLGEGSLAVPLPPASSDSGPGSPDRKSPHKPKVRPSQSETMLVDSMGGFQHSDTVPVLGPAES